MGSNVPHCSSLEILWPVSPAVKRGCRFACLCRLAEFRQNSALGHWLMVAPEAARPPPAPPRPAILFIPPPTTLPTQVTCSLEAQLVPLHNQRGLF